MQRRRIPPQAGAVAKDLLSLMPEVRLFADNYNHLCEFPTVFYAIALVIVLTGHADDMHVLCSRSFVLLRVLHSAVHVSFNVVSIRFTLFMLSWFALAAMILREAAAFYF